MTATRTARAVAVVLALLVTLGLVAPAAAAPASAPQAAPAAAPAAAAQHPTAARSDIWGAMCASGPILPGLSTIGCGKKLVEVGGGAAAKAASKKLANSVLGDFSKAMAGFTSDMLKKSLTWWLATPSVQVKDSGVMEPQNPNDPSRKVSLHAIMLGIGTMIAILLTMIAGFKTMIQRKGQPITQAIQGLLINIFVVAVGVTVIDSLLVASDTLTTAILNVGMGGKAPERMVAMLLPTVANPAGLLAIALVTLLVGIVQVVLLFLRQAAIPIQALLLPIAGAGQVGDGGPRQWLPKLLTAIMCVIVYKPAAALIITVGFVEIENSDKVVDWIRGVVTLVLSVIALKGLMGIFSPLGVSMAAAGGGAAGGLLGMAGSFAGSHMGGSGDSGGEGGSGGSGGTGGTSPADQAAHMDRHGPASGGGSQGGSSEGSSAVQQANSSSVPAQQGAGAAAEGAAAGAGEGAAAAGTGAAGGSAAGASSAGAAAGGPVGIAIVAAEAAKGAVDKSADTLGGKENNS